MWSDFNYYRLTPTNKKALPILALFTVGILFLPSNVDAFGLLGSGTTETVRTIPGEMAGEFQHFFKICAGENDRLGSLALILQIQLQLLELSSKTGMVPVIRISTHC